MGFLNIGTRKGPIFTSQPSKMLSLVPNQSNNTGGSLPFAYLSGEIWDMIIDHLHDDRRALARCGLVQRSWMAASRCHLFLSIKLTEKDNMKDLREILSVEEYWPGRLRRKHGVSAIVTYIRHIVMRVRGHDPRRWFEGVMPILNTLPSLQGVTLMNCSWTSLIDGLTDRPPPPLISRLLTLSFHLVTFRSAEAMFSVIAAVENLQELHINGCFIASTTFHRQIYINPLCLQLNRLQISGMQVVLPTLQWIQGWQSKPNFTSLVISSFGRDARDSVLKLVAANRTTLQRLAFQCDGDFRDDDGRFELIDTLSHMTAITTLSFGWTDITYDHKPGYISVIVLNHSGPDRGFWPKIIPTLVDLAYYRGTRHIEDHLLPLAGQSQRIQVTVLITGMSNFHDPHTVARQCCSRLIDTFRNRGGQLRFESVPSNGLSRLTLDGFLTY